MGKRQEMPAHDCANIRPPKAGSMTVNALSGRKQIAVYLNQGTRNCSALGETWTSCSSP